MRNDPHDYLPRLEPGCYRGQAYVHWVMTIQDRKPGWLIPNFYYKFREILAHAAFRYAFVCPIYCLMPDHIHMLWIGIDDRSDQLKASEYFRKRLGEPLKKLGFEFQHQPYDHVLNDEERLENEVCNLVEYIARNPERKNLVAAGQFKSYPYTDCLMPGYPELRIWQPDFWTRFWRCYSFLSKMVSSVPLTKNCSLVAMAHGSHRRHRRLVATVARRWNCNLATVQRRSFLHTTAWQQWLQCNTPPLGSSGYVPASGYAA